MSLDTMTLEALANETAPAATYRIEIHALDSSWYMVRLHSREGVLILVDENQRAVRYTGPQWISRALRPLGFTDAVLTHSDVFDEMIGAPTQTVSPEERLAFGTRVALQT
ncbi:MULTISPECIES: DUF6482 family protein [unclassified Halomonas]|uniref:DUF6482 family protein n=1 Tax=unclassified Halomonas TaxID=2609666 RepID=UPI0020769F69|nr:MULTISPECIES: DUF6482 family protein [unclassified Halomonas]